MFPQVGFAQSLPSMTYSPQNSRQTPKCSSDTLKTTSVIQINSSARHCGALEASCSDDPLRRPLHPPLTYLYSLSNHMPASLALNEVISFAFV